MANNYNQATVSPDLPASQFSSAELEALGTSCGLQSEPSGDHLYFFAQEYFSEEDEDPHGERVDCIKLFQAKLRQLDPVIYPQITIEGAATCSKMRPGEFGGFAYSITRDEIRHFSTWQWLHQQGTEADPHLRVMNAGPALLEALVAASDWIDAQIGTPRTDIQAKMQRAIAEATGRPA